MAERNQKNVKTERPCPKAAKIVKSSSKENVEEKNRPFARKGGKERTCQKVVIVARKCGMGNARRLLVETENAEAAKHAKFRVKAKKETKKFSKVGMMTRIGL